MTSQLLLASPIGAIAGWLYCKLRWPYALCRSTCSNWLVAGSTISAYRAVSVRNRSWTTVKRSSRWSPCIIRPAFGDEVTGLAQNTNSDLIGGSCTSPVSAAPILFILTDWGVGGHSEA